MKETELNGAMVDGYIFGVEVGMEQNGRNAELARLAAVGSSLEGIKGMQRPCDDDQWILLLFGTLNQAKIARNELWAMGFSCSGDEIEPCSVKLAASEMHGRQTPAGEASVGTYESIGRARAKAGQFTNINIIKKKEKNNI